MKRPNDRYKCDEELGKRLRECRLRAGLTQQKLATAMGRQGRGSHHVAGRLERGEVPNPTLTLIADYLRACRASFKDIRDVLDAYTGRPSAVEVETRTAIAREHMRLPSEIDRAVQSYDAGVTTRAEQKQEPVPAPTERVRRARNFGLSQVWAKRVRRRVGSIIETQHLRPGPMNEQHLQNDAAKVWRVLNRTRGKRGGSEKREARAESEVRRQKPKAKRQKPRGKSAGRERKWERLRTARTPRGRRGERERENVQGRQGSTDDQEGRLESVETRGATTPSNSLVPSNPFAAFDFSAPGSGCLTLGEGTNTIRQERLLRP